MPIHTQDYRHWEGTLKPHSPMRWWVITKAELKLLAQRKLVRLIVAIPPAIYVLVHAMLIYLGNELLSEESMPFVIDKAFFHRFFFSFRFVFLSGFLVALVTIFGGSGLIATDMKNNALSLYLSKPISWVDYLIGKFAVIGTLLGLHATDSRIAPISGACAVHRYRFLPKTLLDAVLHDCVFSDYHHVDQSADVAIFIADFKPALRHNRLQCYLVWFQCGLWGSPIDYSEQQSRLGFDLGKLRQTGHCAVWVAE